MPTITPDPYDSDTHEKPCAAAGLTSYRCRGMWGWIMIGAKDHTDAIREARRSCDNVKPETLEVWDGAKYVKAHPKRN